MMEHGLKINNMGRPQKHGQMVLNSRVIILWAKNKEKGFLIGKMEVNMKANFSKIIQKAKVHMNGLMVENIQVIGKIIK